MSLQNKAHYFNDVENKFEEENFLKAVKQSYTKADLCRNLGLKVNSGNYTTVERYIRKYNVDISHFNRMPWNKGKRWVGANAKPLSEILVKNSSYTQGSKLRKKLIDANLKENKCEVCGYTENLQLHHINGDHFDNRLENLQILCPNCHAKTDSYCGKGKRTKIITPKFNFITEEESLKRLEKKRTKKSKKEPFKIKCEECGKEFETFKVDKHFCSIDCYRKHNSKNIPSLTVLVEDLLKYKSFVRISSEYNVSDKTVAKWFNHYSLGEKKSETLSKLLYLKDLLNNMG